MPDGTSIVFKYTVGWSRDYSSAFRSAFDEVTLFQAILARARTSGRILLIGKGGSGKTTIVLRLAEIANSEGASACVVDLKHWSADIERAWNELGNDVLARADLLLSELGQPPRSLIGIDQQPAEVLKYIFIDGLNETRSAVAEQVIAAADRLAGSFINLSVVATDRLIRREAALTNWQFARVLPLDEEMCRAAIERTIGTSEWGHTTAGQKRLLESPFFLDKAIEQGSVGSNMAELIGGYLKKHVGLSDDDLASAAQASFHAYRDGGGSRTFDLATFRSQTGPGIADKLLHAGVVSMEDDTAYFSHHLFHDYLAARYLAGQPNEWDYVAFNAVTFNASSFDAVSLTLQLLPPGSADDFIRRVYDWNPYAAAYLIADVQDGGVSDEMKFVIAGMLAERLQDIFAMTAERSADALSILGTPEAEQLRDASFNDMLKIAAGKNSEMSWFREWQSLFTQAPGGEMTEGHIVLLTSPDPILGWTAANVIRRLHARPDDLDRLRRLATAGEASTFRWRAVHALGAFPSDQTRATLEGRLTSDVDEWVRYGAIRSLLENAARSPQLRSKIFAELANQAEMICRSSRLRDEFSRAVLARIEGPKDTWLAGVGAVLRELAARTENRRDFERWVKLGDRVETYLSTAG